MYAEQFYVVRSKQTGQYLLARPQLADPSEADLNNPKEFLLTFREHADALTYLNRFAESSAAAFAVEAIAGSQVGKVLTRWGYHGIALVSDPLVPQVDFMVRA
jgi:hypothetical protein